MVALGETREAGSAYLHCDNAIVYELPDATHLIRVIVNTPADSATVVVAETDGSIVGVLDASKRDAGVVFHARVDGLVVTLDDATLDVTVTYD